MGEGAEVIEDGSGLLIDLSGAEIARPKHPVDIPGSPRSKAKGRKKA